MSLTPNLGRGSSLEPFAPPRGLILALGIGLILLGLLALGSLPFVTAAYVLYLGFALIIGGILCGIQAFFARRSPDFFLAMLISILDIVVGLLMVTHVGGTAAVMTLMLAVFFLVGGLFRIAASMALRSPNWLWTLLSGVVSVLLGASIWRQWPIDSFWVIGLFIGLELLFRGWALVMLGLALPSAPASHSTSGSGAIPT